MTGPAGDTGEAAPQARQVRQGPLGLRAQGLTSAQRPRPTGATADDAEQIVAEAASSSTDDSSWIWILGIAALVGDRVVHVVADAAMAAEAPRRTEKAHELGGRRDRRCAAPDDDGAVERRLLGVGAMVGAGIFSLLGAAGEVAGAAVWLSFVIAGAIAMLRGTRSQFGATYPSAGGMLEYVARGFGLGHVSAITAWLILGERDRHGDGAGLVRELREFDVHGRERRLGEGLRRPRRGLHDRREHHRDAGGREVQAPSCSWSSGSSGPSRS